MADRTSEPPVKRSSRQRARPWSKTWWMPSTEMSGIESRLRNRVQTDLFILYSTVVMHHIPPGRAVRPLVGMVGLRQRSGTDTAYSTETEHHESAGPEYRRVPSSAPQSVLTAQLSCLKPQPMPALESPASREPWWLGMGGWTDQIVKTARTSRLLLARGAARRPMLNRCIQVSIQVGHIPLKQSPSPQPPSPSSHSAVPGHPTRDPSTSTPFRSSPWRALLPVRGYPHTFHASHTPS